MIELIQKYPVVAGLVFSLATFVAGLVIGNWQAICRDKRKEFNSVARSIRADLIFEKQHLTPAADGPSIVKFDEFEQVLRWWYKRAWFNRTKLEYLACKQDVTQDKVGQASYRDTQTLARLIDNLIWFTKRR